MLTCEGLSTCTHYEVLGVVAIVIVCKNENTAGHDKLTNDFCTFRVVIVLYHRANQTSVTMKYSRYACRWVNVCKVSTGKKVNAVRNMT